MRSIIITTLIFCLWPSLAGAIGRFEITSPDSSTVLRLQLAAQLQTVFEDKDRGEGNQRESALFSKVRRVRPSLTVSVPEYRTSFRLHLSTAPGSLELMDLYFDSKLSSDLSIRVGQYKIPFTRYRIQSFQRLTFVDWSIITRYFGAERQIGLSIHNGYEKPPRLAYALGIFSGVNARASHATGLASVYGEKVVNPSDLTGPSTKTEFHPELACHLAFNSNEINVRSDSDLEGGPLRYSIATSVAWDLDPTEFEDLAVRIAQEFLMKYRRLSLMGAGLVGFADIDGSFGTRKALSGLLVQSSYALTERCEISARYAVVDIDNYIANTALSRAHAIVASSVDVAIIAQYSNAGMVLSEQEGAIGFNVYLDGHNLKLQTDCGFSKHERRNGDRTDYTIRSQLQLSF